MPNLLSIHAAILCIDKNAEVDGHANANSSKIKEASKRLRPKPPSFSETYIPAKPNSPAFLNTFFVFLSTFNFLHYVFQ